MALPSWAHLGIGIGLTALAITFVAKASSQGNVRFINVRSPRGVTTIRIRKLGGGTFEAGAWGEGIAFKELPNSEPLGTYTFSKGTPLNATGNPEIIAFLHNALPNVPVDNLFAQAGSERCARPGCELPA